VSIAVAALFASAVIARRAPGPGGTAAVAVPPELVPAVVEAHLYAPLLVPASRDPAVADRPALPGAPGFASTVLTKIAVDGAGARWTLSSTAPAASVADSVQRCLDGRVASGFAAGVLRAAGVHARVEVAGNDVVVVVDRAVFVLPALLSYCPLVGSGGAATGAYAEAAAGRLSWRSGSFDPPPLLGAVDVRGTAAPGDKADVVAMATSADNEGGATLLAPWSDVVLLVQGTQARDADPFGLNDPRAGVRAFRGGLRADLLAAAWAAGRGGPTEALLPPGVAPARPLPAAATGAERTPLALVPVPADAPRVKLAVRTSDALTDGVAERLAVLLRARGALLDVHQGDGDASTCELVRWHPPTRDAALALLAFLGERPDLLEAPAVGKALDTSALLSADAAKRLGAALALERALLDSRLVVPLLVVDRWLTVDPDLRGVVLREDGVPLLDGAWWGGGR
jgi:hypothetical protein